MLTQCRQVDTTPGQVNPWQRTHDVGQTSLGVVQGHFLAQEGDNTKVGCGAASEIRGGLANAYFGKTVDRVKPHIHPARKLEVRGHHTYDCEHHAIKREGLTECVGITSEVGLPKSIA